jgi:hypothetical protein
MDDYLKNWIYSLKGDMLGFLDKMKDSEKLGFYKYSMTGDIPTADAKWGLGNAVFAAKILYMLDKLKDEDKEYIANFIKTFQNEEGEIYDPTVQRLSRFDRWSRPLISLDFGNITNTRTRRAETRQAFAALMSIDRAPKFPYMQVPVTAGDIKWYIRSLDWFRPWAAASHVSHLAFFLNANNLFFKNRSFNSKKLEEYIFSTAEEYRQADGSWYDSRFEVSTAQKVNAAMKMITAYATFGRNDFRREKDLIDLCLEAANDRDACDNLNIVLVLYYCHKNSDHRSDEICSFCEDRLKIYKRHYWPEYGGFSFYKQRANDIYYGAKISRGHAEPDIHGTVMFLWGIIMISEILDPENNYGFRLPIT